MFTQDSQVLTPHPPPLSHLFALACFGEPPFPLALHQGTFVSARIQPLPLNLFTCDIWRREINNEY